MEAKQPHIGSGWKFPPQLDARGRIELASGDRDIQEAIKIVLLTRKGERPMRPEFGSDLETLVFAANDAATAGLAERYVADALARWEPRIEVMSVDAKPSNGRAALDIDIKYRIRASNDERNLVFPFYTIPGEE